MRIAWRLIRPLLLFPLLFFPYLLLNDTVIVDWLGCGCVEGFNANHFTALFWGLVALLVIVLCCRAAGQLQSKPWRAVYILVSSLLALFSGYICCGLMQWN